MLRCVVCVAAMLLIGQSKPVYIERTMVYADYGSIYIQALANKIVPPDKAIQKTDIDCLLTEIRKSGLFGDVQAHIERGNKRTRELSVKAQSAPGLRDMLLGEVVISGFEDTSQEKFSSKLKEYDVRPGQMLVKHSLNELMEKINRAARETVPGGDEMETPWINIEPAGPKTIRFTVAPSYRRCTASPARD